MELYSTKRFNDSYNKLLSKANKYGCLNVNTFKVFNKKPIAELFDKGYSLNGKHDVARLLKFRVKSCNQNGKSSGFRIIAFIHLKDEKVYFLEVYPKTGPMAKSNANKDERSTFIKELKAEKDDLLKVELNSKSKKLIIQK